MLPNNINKTTRNLIIDVVTYSSGNSLRASFFNGILIQFLKVEKTSNYELFLVGMFYDLIFFPYRY